MSNTELGRREFMLALSTMCVVAPGIASAAQRPELIDPVSLPDQVPVTEGYAPIADGKLWYWDTGGEGDAVVLSHPATGSGAIWGYQQPVFARAGYRVIGYSRRGYHRSSPTTGAPSASPRDDLIALIDHLQLSRFHGIGSAAGGGVMLAYALKQPEKLASLTIACSLGDVQDEDYAKLSASLRPPGFNAMPAEFRELGPNYRAANPNGVARWLELQKMSRNPENAPAARPPPAATDDAITWAKLAELKLPLLWLAGDADLFTPPAVLKHFAARVRGSEIAVIDGAGHSAYWEQPTQFNRAVLDFLKRHSRKRRR